MGDRTGRAKRDSFSRSGAFLMPRGLLALRRNNPESYLVPAPLRWRVFDADRVFKNSGARLPQESTNDVKTGLFGNLETERNLGTTSHRNGAPWTLPLTTFGILPANLQALKLLSSMVA